MNDKYASSPCLLGERHPDIDPAYLGHPEHFMKILASNTILYCRNWQAMVDFYQGTLGFEQTFRKDSWFIELRISAGCHISLADEAHCTIGSSAGKGLTLSFKVADLAATHRHFTACGAKPTAITSHSWRAPYFYVHDPEGNRIELWNDA
jgi:catechol 2,3-dioxygenase-like lactoylglutathione lyase family enzyme